MGRRKILSLFGKLFGKSKTVVELPKDNESISEAAESREWEVIPAFIPTDSKEYQLVSLIATAIATNDQKESQFVVKKILKRNPEAKTVSLIAASIATGAMEESQLVIKKISKKLSEG